MFYYFNEVNLFYSFISEFIDNDGLEIDYRYMYIYFTARWQIHVGRV